MAGFERGRLDAQEASMKYFLLGAFASAFLLYGIAFIFGGSGTTNLLRIRADRRDRGPGRLPARRRRRRAARRRPRVQGRDGAVPHVDAGRLSGRPDAGDRLHGRRDEGRRVRGASSGRSTCRSTPCAGTGGRRCRCWPCSRSASHRSSRWPRPTSSGCSRTRRSRTRGSSPSRWPRRVRAASRRRCCTSSSTPR